jgi:hypothetical protein
VGSPHHTPATIETALIMLALAGDSPTKATAMLKHGGIKVSRAALAEWRDADPERWSRIRENAAARIERDVAHTARALAIDYAQLEAEAIAETRLKLASGDTRDPSTVARNAAVGKGINVDKLLLLEGRPTAITEQRSADDVLRGLAAKGYIVGTADEDDASLELQCR